MPDISKILSLMIPLGDLTAIAKSKFDMERKRLSDEAESAAKYLAISAGCGGFSVAGALATAFENNHWPWAVVTAVGVGGALFFFERFKSSRAKIEEMINVETRIREGVEESTRKVGETVGGGLERVRGMVSGMRSRVSGMRGGDTTGTVDDEAPGP